MSAFDKDAWILAALKDETYKVRMETSRVFKLKRIVAGRRIYLPVVPCTHKRTGRVYFTMTYKGVTKSVLLNRIVALACIPNPYGLPEVNHKDGNKANNRWENLEWSSRSEQEKHAFATGLKSARGSSNANAKLTAAAVHEIREAPDASLSDLCEKYNVSARTIANVRARRTWSHLP